MSALPAACLEALSQIVGDDYVTTSATDLQLASIDLIDWPGQQPGICMVQPRDTTEVSRVVNELSRFNMPVIPRGAGLSYSGGAVPLGPAVILDLRRLDTLSVFPDDMIAVVGAGATWSSLSDALVPYGLKTAQQAPISGVHTTFGGAAAQGMPGGVEGFLGVTVVRADGSVVSTGSGSQKNSTGFQRYAGPDLTGIFLGDCGAFGIKTEVVVKLVPIKPLRFASFECADASACLRIMITLLRRGLVARVFANGPSEDAGQAQAWKLNIVVEAATEIGAEDTLRAVREIGVVDGSKIDNTTPATLAAKPYSVRGFLGIQGEQWLPVHGVLPLSQATDCVGALQAAFRERQTELAGSGIQHTWMLSSVGAYITIEPMLYWSDALSALHLHYLNDRNRARFGGKPEALTARQTVKEMRSELRDIMDRHGAVHAQLGRFFPYIENLDAGTATLARELKTLLDPGSRMNPGVLGL